MQQEKAYKKLESLILNLGEEIFKVKHTLSSVTAQNSEFLSVINALKELLDEKGLMSKEEFDVIIQVQATEKNINDFYEINNSEELSPSLKKKIH